MNASAVSAVIAAIAAISGAFLSYRAASGANRINSRKVDQEAYERAQAITDKVIDRLQGQADRLALQMETVNNRLAQEMDVSNVLRDQVRTLRAQVDDLTITVANLRAERATAGRP